jgi:hypothetical protein
MTHVPEEFDEQSYHSPIKIQEAAMKTTMTLIVNPMNPWLQGNTVEDRLLEYWHNREQKTSSNPCPQTNCPLKVLKIY